MTTRTVHTPDFAPDDHELVAAHVSETRELNRSGSVWPEHLRQWLLGPEGWGVESHPPAIAAGLKEWWT